ncbi:hypothetical protein SAURM35S_07662 [Streptomyces aurantiogriseus]
MARERSTAFAFSLSSTVTVVAPSSSESASRPRSRRADLTAVAASPDWEECASSTMIAKRVPLISVGLRLM